MIESCSLADKDEIFRLAQVFYLDVVDYNKETVLVECIKSEDKNNEMIELFTRTFPNRVEVVRGGNVAIERA